jgi:hypothetical protein
MESMKQTIQRATAELMADIIKRSRARYAALPQAEKDRYVRWLEDEKQIALAAERGAQ